MDRLAPRVGNRPKGEPYRLTIAAKQGLALVTRTTRPSAMTFTTSPNPDALPLRFPSGLRFTPEQFELVCAENREAVVE